MIAFPAEDETFDTFDGKLKFFKKKGITFFVDTIISATR
jgi:hypothetical protein